MSGFVLDARLAADTQSVMIVDNIDVRLSNDSRYWWLLLVPQIAGAEEWQDLPETDRACLFDLSMRCANGLRTAAQADKMNVAALGNMVRQLHVHVIARHIDDAAWPAPIWGVGEGVDYRPEDARQRMMVIQGFLNQ